MKDYFVMPKTKGLSFIEEAVLMVLCRQGLGKDGRIHISREAIANAVGLKDLDTISKHTGKLVNSGYINKKDGFDGKGHNLVTYQINKCSSYRIIKNCVYSLNIRLAVFLIRISDLRLGNTTMAHLNNKTIAEKLSIKERTFYKYIKQAIELGIVYKIEDGYSLNENWFPVIKKTSLKNQLSDEEMQIAKEYAKIETKEGKLMKWFLEKELFFNIKGKRIFNEILAGVFKYKP